jgi:hypothetical protein
LDAALLIGIYIVTTIIVQAVAFGISRAVDYQFPAAGLLTFLILFFKRILSRLADCRGYLRKAVGRSPSARREC